jgi:hypothetical protein
MDMKDSGSMKLPLCAREYLIIAFAAIYLVTVFAAIIRFYFVHSFLPESDCKETLAIILF